MDASNVARLTQGTGTEPKALRFAVTLYEPRLSFAIFLY